MHRDYLVIPFITLGKVFQSKMKYLLFVVTNSCEDRPRTNPFDPETKLDSSEWMPSNLQVAWINDLQIKLTWTQEYNQVSGFRISTKEGSGSFTNCKWKMKNLFWR